jgi:hypothetical protein
MTTNEISKVIRTIGKIDHEIGAIKREIKELNVKNAKDFRVNIGIDAIEKYVNDIFNTLNYSTASTSQENFESYRYKMGYIFRLINTNGFIEIDNDVQIVDRFADFKFEGNFTTKNVVVWSKGVKVGDGNCDGKFVNVNESGVTGFLFNI